GIALSAGSQQAPAQTVKDFALTNVMNNEVVSLKSFPTCEGLILVFTSNSCPYDEYYRSRIDALGQAYRDRVPLLLVNSQADPNESPQRMAAKGKALKLSVPYLAD